MIGLTIIHSKFFLGVSAKLGPCVWILMYVREIKAKNG